MNKFKLVDKLQKKVNFIIQWHVMPIFLEWKVNLHFILQSKPSKFHGLGSSVIVSLTSYPPRFEKLPLTLKCLLSQNMVADKIILWIAYEDKVKLTPEILSLQKNGLEIAFCEDLRSYKKIIPTLKEYPDSIIVTADDDLYYGSTWLEELVGCYKNNTDNVICHRLHRIYLDVNKFPLNYTQWEFESQSLKVSPLNFPTSGGGVLYPPKILYSEVLNAQAFNNLCPDADDIWLYWMIRLNGKEARKSNLHYTTYCWSGTQEISLYNRNETGGNDLQISAMLEAYGNVLGEKDEYSKNS